MRRVTTFLLAELREVLPPVAFFLVGFNLIVLTTQLLTPGRYGLAMAGFLLATTGALLVGKAVLVADMMPFLRRLDGAPLVQPILFKVAVYWGFVFIARLLEALVAFLLHGGAPAGFLTDLASDFSWRRFIAIQLWILVLFLIYVTASELNALFGDGELAAILFRRRSDTLKLSRRQRIRALVTIGRLTETHGPAVLRDPASPAHRELIGLLRRLAGNGRASG